jgi:hypothetical protein
VAYSGTVKKVDQNWMKDPSLMIPYTYAADRKNLQSYAIEMYEKKFSRKKLNKKNHSSQPKEQK